MSPSRRYLLMSFVVLLLGSVGIALAAPPGAAAAPTYSYGEALQKSLFFYEAQVAGRKPAWNRVLAR